MQGYRRLPRSEVNSLPWPLQCPPSSASWHLLGAAGHASTLCREILQGQAPVLALHDGKATLQLQDGGQSVTFDLDKASLPEARRQLQDLTFGLVEQLQTLEKRLEGAAGFLERAWADWQLSRQGSKAPADHGT